MSRPVYWTAIVLFLVGGGAFLYKHLTLEMPIRPDRSARVWRVEMAISARGDARRGRIELLVPRSDDNQILLDEQSFDDGLAFEITETETDRRATWRGPVGDAHRFSYTFRVHLPESVGNAEASRRSALSLRALDESASTRPTKRYVAPVIEDTLAQIGLQKGDEPDAVIASAFGFVAHEIEMVIGGSEDARLVLRSREGNEVGKSRLLVELLRAAGVEARLAMGIRMRGHGKADLTHFVQARTLHDWIPLYVAAPTPGEFPKDFVVIAQGDRSLLATSGIAASHVDLEVLRESLPAAELASFVAPESPFWRAVSLFRLPVETQATLQVLLVMPLAVLIAALFRNLVGIRTFGTFMPILIALSLRRTDLASGLVLVTSVTLAGVVGRLLLDRLRLLFVPRICLLLCLVVLLITALAQAGYAFGGRGLMSGLLFPIVILAMLIERISVTTLEEGFESTAKLLMGSLVLAALVYPIFQSEWISFLFFGFPELIFCVMAFLVAIGGYTGYRLSELWRFRSLVASEEGGAA